MREVLKEQLKELMLEAINDPGMYLQHFNYESIVEQNIEDVLKKFL